MNKLVEEKKIQEKLEKERLEAEKQQEDQDNGYQSSNIGSTTKDVFGGSQGGYFNKYVNKTNTNSIASANVKATTNANYEISSQYQEKELDRNILSSIATDKSISAKKSKCLIF